MRTDVTLGSVTTSQKNARPRKNARPQADPVPQRHLGYKQQRSLETFEGLLAAAEELVSKKSFDEVSVNDICDQAGLSVGAFYRRFESKESLLQLLHERYAERVMHLQAAALSPQRWEGVPLEQLLTQVIEEVVKLTTRNSGLLRAATRLAQSNSEVAKREQRIQAEFHACVTRLVLQRVEVIGHPRPRTAAEFCAHQLRAVVYCHLVIEPAFRLMDDTFSEAELVRELSISLISYLRSSADHAEAALGG